MSTYDQLALSAFPTLYLASPNTTDQSNSSTYSLADNDLSLTGQSIIYGHLHSFYLDNVNTVTINGDLGFFQNGNSLEFVIYSEQPDEEFPILQSDTLSGIYVDSQNIIFRLHFIDIDDVVYSIDTRYRVEKWNSKFHVIVYFNNNDAELVINGLSSKIDYIHETVVPTEFTLGTSVGNWVNIDGISTYNKRVPDKSQYINDLNNGHSVYSTSILDGSYTLFDTSEVLHKYSFTELDFQTFPGEQDYILNIISPPVVNELSNFVVVRVNAKSNYLTYKTDLMADWDMASDTFFIDNDPTFTTITFRWQPDSSINQIDVVLEYYADGKIQDHSPAILSLTGQSVYYDSQDSMVNVPRGIKLIDSYYTGEWVLGNDLDIPLSVEIIFVPSTVDVDTFVFFNEDGHASFGPTGSIEGFTAYLNGVEVASLDVIPGQLYHLVLVNDSPTDNNFYLNYDGTNASSISYLLLSAYQNELSEAQSLTLFSVLVGADVLAHSELIDFIQETETEETGTAYNPYSYAWSIIGAGGH